MVPMHITDTPGAGSLESDPPTVARGSAFAALSLAVLAGLPGCATIYEGKYAWSQGWRDIRVEQILRGSEIDDPGFWNCLRSKSADEIATGSFALVVYLQSGRRKRSMVPLGSANNSRVGDRLYANLSTCEIRGRGVDGS